MQKKRRVAAYCRVSTDQQATGLESQIRAIKLHFEHNKIDDFEIFTDEGISGTKSSRPSLDRMMGAVRNGEISSVVVYSFSRFARSVTHLLSALEEMNKFDVSFLSLTEKIETNSPMGRAFFTVIAAISQLERDLIAERVRNGLANAKAKGIHIGRKKQRNSVLIRALLAKGVPYRSAAAIASCSHGAIWAEKQEMLKEAAALAKANAIESEKQLGSLELPIASSPPMPDTSLPKVPSSQTVEEVRVTQSEATEKAAYEKRLRDLVATGFFIPGISTSR